MPGATTAFSVMDLPDTMVGLAGEIDAERTGFIPNLMPVEAEASPSPRLSVTEAQ